MRSLVKRLALPATMLLTMAQAFADVLAPAPVTVKSVRPHVSNNRVYVELTAASVCGTAVYSINLAKNAGKELSAVAVAAMTSGRRLRVEIPGTCPSTAAAAWGMEIQSMYIE